MLETKSEIELVTSSAKRMGLIPSSTKIFKHWGPIGRPFIGTSFCNEVFQDMFAGLKDHKSKTASGTWYDSGLYKFILYAPKFTRVFNSLPDVEKYLQELTLGTTGLILTAINFIDNTMILNRYLIRLVVSDSKINHIIIKKNNDIYEIKGEN